MNAVTYLDENYCNLILSTDNYIWWKFWI